MYAPLKNPPPIPAPPSPKKLLKCCSFFLRLAPMRSSSGGERRGGGKEEYVIVQGFFQGGWRGGICHPLALACPPWICYSTCKSIQAFSPRFHQIASNKRFKIKIPRGTCPRTPLVWHMLCTQIHTCPPYSPDDVIWPSLGQKAERNPVVAGKEGWLVHIHLPNSCGR